MYSWHINKNKPDDCIPLSRIFDQDQYARRRRIILQGGGRGRAFGRFRRQPVRGGGSVKAQVSDLIFPTVYIAFELISGSL